jgi:hypothetical protein
MAKTLIIAVLMLASTAAQADTVHDLISVARDLNTACRGGMPDDKGNLDQLCAIREKLGKVINNLGYCYGKRGQAAAQMQWHRCTSTSMREGRKP